MTTPNRGVGKFATQNLVAVLESNGTYADVVRVAEDYDGDVRSHTIANWVQAGNADMRKGNNATAYARFSKICADRLKEHGGAEANRARELDCALEILERACECGNEKMLRDDGARAEPCRAPETRHHAPPRSAPDGSNSRHRRLDAYAMIGA